MRIVHVHNEYGTLSGEEIMFRTIVELLREHGHEVLCFCRSSSQISPSLMGKTKAFFSGIYSFSSRKLFRKLICEFKPDIIQVQNLYPLISPSVLLEAALQKIPVAMRCANYRLICPNGLFMIKRRICEKCSGGREWWCFLRNCENSLFKSAGYALRNYVARKLRFFINNVTMYICLTEFQKHKLIADGFPADRIAVVPNVVDPKGVEASEKQGEYVGYVGRISPEKGLQTIIELARSCNDIQFKAAGSYDRIPQLAQQAPDNFEFIGHLDKKQLDVFYNNSRMIVLPSICYEGFPSVVIEAMVRQKPVICSRIGGLPEIVEDGVTGLLFEPGRADELAGKICYLWERPQICRKMGQTGCKKALREYSPEKYYERLMAIYEKAIELGPGGTNHNS